MQGQHKYLHHSAWVVSATMSTPETELTVLWDSLCHCIVARPNGLGATIFCKPGQKSKMKAAAGHLLTSGEPLVGGCVLTFSILLFGSRDAFLTSSCFMHSDIKYSPPAVRTQARRGAMPTLACGGVETLPDCSGHQKSLIQPV